MIALKNATLIDGSGKGPVEGITILIENGRIQEVGTDLNVPEDADIINLKGKTVIPGLIDAHIHINGSSRLDRPGASHLIPVSLWKKHLRSGTALKTVRSSVPRVFVCPGLCSRLRADIPVILFLCRIRMWNSSHVRS